MNVFCELRHGLGDCIACHFHRRQSALSLARMIAGYHDGSIDRIGVVGGVEHPPNPAAFELFASIGVQQRTWEDVKDWTNATELDGQPPVYPIPLPTVQPTQAVPRKYVLFSQWAGRDDRCLDDVGLYRAIKDATRLPIVKIGRTRTTLDLERIPCDLDLTDRTTVAQSLWLAKHAVCIVAPCSWLRNMAWSFATPVVELVQIGRVLESTMERTNEEYGRHAYGMKPYLNYWYTWPDHRAEVSATLTHLAAGLPPAVTFRPGTLDRHTWEEVYRDNCYRIPPDMTGKTVLDIGANTGAFSALCLVRGANKVIAFESAPQNVEALRVNLRPYGDRAEVRDVAVWDKATTLRLGDFPAENTGAANVLADYGPGVPAVAFDEVLREMGTVNLVKIDCEGAEYPILLNSGELSRAREFVGEWHTEVVDVIGKGTGPDVLAECLKGQGFDFRVIEDGGRIGLWAASITG